MITFSVDTNFKFNINHVSNFGDETCRQRDRHNLPNMHSFHTRSTKDT